VKPISLPPVLIRTANITKLSILGPVGRVINAEKSQGFHFRDIRRLYSSRLSLELTTHGSICIVRYISLSLSQLRRYQKPNFLIASSDQRHIIGPWAILVEGPADRGTTMPNSLGTGTIMLHQIPVTGRSPLSLRLTSGFEAVIPVRANDTDYLTRLR
jgi:hypothetical protein